MVLTHGIACFCSSSLYFLYFGFQLAKAKGHKANGHKAAFCYQSVVHERFLGVTLAAMLVNGSLASDTKRMAKFSCTLRLAPLQAFPGREFISAVLINAHSRHRLFL